MSAEALKAIEQVASALATPEHRAALEQAAREIREEQAGTTDRLARAIEENEAAEAKAPVSAIANWTKVQALATVRLVEILEQAFPPPGDGKRKPRGGGGS